ncbi:MAG: phosphorylase/glycogen(starch) synthase, partial [Planctomycetota bacterium]
GVDSLSGEWDYVEPVLFGHAVGRVIERWLEEFSSSASRRSVIHSHEWMTGSAVLYAKQNLPSVGTVFTTHATMLGRALSSLGHSPEDGLGGQTPEQLAEDNGVVAKHSLEGICAREADAFTTVSEITAREAELLHGRSPDPLTPNGIDLSVIDEVAGDTTRADVRTALTRVASTFLGEDVTDAAFACISGRYEFHNKGIDMTLDAVRNLEDRSGRRVVLFVLVPAGNSGMSAELRERLDGDTPTDGPLGISTHNLHNQEQDPVIERCASLGLVNAPGSRIKIVQVPIYLSADDGFLNEPYEAVLRAMDLSAFPSYYEPWGYTPQESLAVGVPTITSDYAGFGRWAAGEGLSRADGVFVLERVKKTFENGVSTLEAELERFLSSDVDAQTLRGRCRKAADRASWRDLAANYTQAHSQAIDGVQKRLEQGVPQLRRPRRVVSVESSHDSKVPHLIAFDVSATLPGALAGLARLARNPWWSWDPEAASLFEEISPRSWAACDHDPVAFLQRVYPEDARAKAKDAEFVAKVKRVMERFERELSEPSLKGRWTEGRDASGSISVEHPVAYFSAEFGIHESLRIYSGGLGVLAGDHLKAASDMNLPLIGIGILYSHGYMGQSLSPSGEQVAIDHVNDPLHLGLEAVREPGGELLEIVVPLPGRDLHLRAWRYNVGRIALYLLDANVDANREEDRDITRNLYGGDGEMRLQQEIVLGRGGVRLLRKLQIQPSVWHMNEGHAAFLTIERVGQLALKEGLTFDTARELVRATTLFTTHTPVPAGHDRFGEDLMRRYFSDAAEWVGVPWNQFLSLGQEPEGGGGDFNMTHLALHFSSWVNGVSQLHAEVSRELLRNYWPRLLMEEIPLKGITNGIHLGTWTAPEVMKVLGVRDRAMRGEDFLSKLDKSGRKELWQVRQDLKSRLLTTASESVRERLVQRSESPRILEALEEGLSEKRALVIGFARRFAPYKRAHLLFQDIERLERILNSTDRPVRILIAGKAHPRDGRGKEILQDVFRRSREGSLLGKLVFLEDYDIALARHLVRGVDVWLNNPTRKLEASGTSGMKVCANGGLNLS